MWLQVLIALLSHYWFKNHEPHVLLGAASLLVLPLVVQVLADASNALVLINILSGYLTFYLTLTTSIVLYRLSPFHPLAKYPGPVLLRVTKWAGVAIAVRGDLHTYVQELHEVYGPVVRVGPNELSITHKEAIAPTMGRQGMPRGPLWDGRRFRQAGNTKPYDSLIDVRDNKIHQQLRKDWNVAFGTSALKDYQELVLARVRQMRDGICEAVKAAQGPVDLGKWITHFAFDFMGDLAFGGCFELMREGDVHGIRKGLEDGILLPAIMQHIPWISPVLLAIPFISAKMNAFAQFGVQQSKKRMETPTKRKDLYYHLYEIPGERTARTEAEQFDLIVSNSLLTIVAGSDTTATTLSGTLCYLLSDRKVYNTLRAELDAAFPNSTASVVDGWPEIDVEDLAKLPYLNAVVNEGLRLVPAVPTTIQRAPEPGSGGKVLGNTKIFIPEGVAVDIPSYTIQRDTRYFSPSPEQFIPERWLTTSLNEKIDGVSYTTDREAFIPFSYGPANCAGKPLAIVELRVVIAYLVRCFNIYHYGCKNEEDGSEVLRRRAEEWTRGLKDRFVFDKHGVLVDIVPRRILGTY